MLGLLSLLLVARHGGKELEGTTKGITVPDDGEQAYVIHVRGA
jgi:hypothetical protein